MNGAKEEIKMQTLADFPYMIPLRSDLTHYSGFLNIHVG